VLSRGVPDANLETQNACLLSARASAIRAIDASRANTSGGRLRSLQLSVPRERDDPRVRHRLTAVNTENQIRFRPVLYPQPGMFYTPCDATRRLATVITRCYKHTDAAERTRVLFASL